MHCNEKLPTLVHPHLWKTRNYLSSNSLQYNVIYISIHIIIGVDVLISDHRKQLIPMSSLSMFPIWSSQVGPNSTVNHSSLTCALIITYTLRTAVDDFLLRYRWVVNSLWNGVGKGLLKNLIPATFGSDHQVWKCASARLVTKHKAFGYHALFL
jgi:hypothetical protein